MPSHTLWSLLQPEDIEVEPAQEPSELVITKGDYGLDVLADTDNARADIVFVHGLTGNRTNTWTHKQSATFWPKTLLPQDLERVRIMTFGYDANVVGAFDTVSSNTLRDRGKSLATDLGAGRARTNSVYPPSNNAP